MRTLKNLSLTLILIVSVNALSHAVIFNGENSRANTLTAKPGSVIKADKHFVHATVKDGKLIPVVNLPVVTIYGKRNANNMLLTEKRGNEVIARVDLPEVVISGERITSGYKLRTVASKNGVTPVMDLPEVVVYAGRVNSSSLAWQKTNENNIPVVNLPEVIITADFPESNKVMAVLYKGAFIPVVNLPEVEITADKPRALFAENDGEKKSDRTDFYINGLIKAEAKINKGLSLVIMFLAKTSHSVL